LRIDILAVGSEGDVRPSIALGLGAQRAGYRVRIVTLGGFGELVRGYGLEHLSIGGHIQDIANTLEGRNWIEHRQHVVGYLSGLMRLARAFIEAGISSYWPACGDVEALISTSMGLPVGMHIAERLGVPLIRVSFAPSRHDSAGRTDLITAAHGHVAVFRWAVLRFLLWTQLRRHTNAARAKTLGLPPLPFTDPFGAMDHRGVPVFDAYSPTVVPRPSHWAEWIHVTGYWFLDESPAWVPPQELVDFLAAGSAPVFVGFGSTPFPDPQAATDVVVGALARTGQRGVIVSGRSGLKTGRLTDDVLSVGSVPHSWLLPRVSTAVHHGGAGVTAAALRADLPSVIVPIFGDQPFWAQRVFQLGAASPPIPANRLTTEGLATAIRATADKGMRRRAAALGARIRSEDGVACAVQAMQQHVIK
jgi:sterol 3beta-glucosyltransferase